MTFLHVVPELSASSSDQGSPSGLDHATFDQVLAEVRRRLDLRRVRRPGPAPASVPAASSLDPAVALREAPVAVLLAML